MSASSGPQSRVLGCFAVSSCTWNSDLHGQGWLSSLGPASTVVEVLTGEGLEAVPRGLTCLSYSNPWRPVRLVLPHHYFSEEEEMEPIDLICTSWSWH